MNGTEAAFSLIATALAIFIIYVVVKYAVADGVTIALRRAMRERDRARSDRRRNRVAATRLQ